ncbi:DUF535 family protein [Flavobacterium gelatinilyticum]|uniref:DUF535 family protein n=1 Tax=Flavobacterium gelatinilyticum TaxID=3003260 RepID=UPI00247FD44D|nr:DUF535 family protein [Flavobacterium gelatinilyticum]
MLEKKQDNFNRNYSIESNIITANTKQISVISVMKESWLQASASFAEERKSYRLKQQLKSLFGALTNPYFTCKWYQILKSPDFLFITAYRRRIYLKPYRVYMSIKWTKKQKTKVICDTYKFIMSKNETFKKVISSNKAATIANFRLNDEIQASITLGYDERFRKEGELVFSFSSDQLGGRIVSAAFSFEEISPKQWICRIGCVQGNKNTENESKTAQKLLNGLRPKSLIIFAVQEFSRQLGCVNIYGAGDSIHAYRQKHAIHLPWRHTINFDYDIIWNESGGHPNDDGWFELPLSPVRKSMEDLKSHKRALYRRRYVQMDEIAAQIEASAKKLL